MDDRNAEKLSDLEVKRARTFNDLESVQAAGRSVQRSLAAHRTRREGLNEIYISRLERDDLDEAERLSVYHDWNEALQKSIQDYEALGAERERLHLQEVILVRMITELDHQIKSLKESFS